MKKHEMKKGIRVIDRWYPDWGIGYIKSVLKTRAKIKFPDRDTMTYVDSHYQFLDIYKPKRKKK